MNKLAGRRGREEKVERKRRVVLMGGGGRRRSRSDGRARWFSGECDLGLR
jgi:hypothetical protein